MAVRAMEAPRKDLCMSSSQGWGLTDLGKKRPTNEDAFVSDDSLGLYVVCDGMGGHNAGEVAAAAACSVVVKATSAREATLALVRDGTLPASMLVDIAGFAVAEACATVYRLATSRHHYRGMGTTVTLLLVAGRHAVMAHVGDSRLYRLRGGTIELLTADHTFVADLVKAGVISADQAAQHPYSATLTRAVGAKASVEVDTAIVEAGTNDRFLLASDGLTNAIKADEELLPLLEGDREAVCHRLIDFANETGGSDNITAVVVDVNEDQASSAAASSSA